MNIIFTSNRWSINRVKKIVAFSLVLSVIAAVFLFKEDRSSVIAELPEKIKNKNNGLDVSKETAFPNGRTEPLANENTATGSNFLNLNSNEIDREIEPLSSIILNESDQALIRVNIDAVGLPQQTSELLANLVQEKVTLEKTYQRNLLGRAGDLNESIWAVEDGTASEEQILEVSQFREEVLEALNDYKQRKLEFDSSLQNLLTNEQRQRLEEYEKPIVEQKLKESVGDFVNMMLEILPNVEDYQRDFATTITDSVFETGVDQFYSLGATLQAAEPLSAAFQIDDSKPIFYASEYLDQILTPEQRLVYDVSKLREVSN